MALISRLSQDVAFRGGVISAGASLLALVLLSGITGFFLLNTLEERIGETLTARHEVARTLTSSLSPTEQQVVRDFRRALPVRDEGIFALIDKEGTTLSSNVSGLDCREGFYDGWLDASKTTIGSTMPAVQHTEQNSPFNTERFRFLASSYDENCLVFGSSLFEVDTMRDKVLGLFLWLIPLCMLPAILVGMYQSMKLRSRLRTHADVMRTVSGGDLEARIPVQGKDNIDRLAISTNNSFDRLQESVGTLQQLTSVMAHDLRAPLNRVAIPLDEAMRANQSGETAVKSLEKVQDELEDVRSVFDALLRISQIESGRRRTNFRDINLYEVAEGLYEIYQPVVEDANRTLEFEITGEGSSVIRGDVELMRQAVVNLIENAINYAPEGAVIRVGVVRDPAHPALYVKDNGPGIPEKERPLVLRRLYRYKGSTGGKQGHGLGLSLVKAVTELHEGVILLVDAKPGLSVLLRFDAAPLSGRDQPDA